jgi:hypothetical protein
LLVSVAAEEGMRGTGEERLCGTLELITIPLCPWLHPEYILNVLEDYCGETREGE